MIYRATAKRRDEWCKFVLATQKFTILDADGNHVNKRDIFEQLYDEDDHKQIQLGLLCNNAHPAYHLSYRDQYDEAVAEKQHIEEIVRDVLQGRALTLARSMGMNLHFDHTIKWMTEAMIDVFDNYQTVGETINKRLK